MTVIIDGTTGITAPGTTAAADISYTGTLTGGTGVVNLGSGQFYKDASGNVGIGTASVNAKVQVQVGDISPAASGNMNTGVVIQKDGISPALNIGVKGGADYVWMSSGYANNSGIGVPMVFMTGATERARIDSSGNLLVGTTSQIATVSRFTLGVPNATQWGISMKPTDSDGSYRAASFANFSNTNIGAISCTTSATSYVTTSDYRLKEDITPMEGALAKIAALNPVTYKWKATGESTNGFIAHELQAIVPECVVGEKDAVETYTDEDGNEATRPVYQGIDTSFLVATLTAAIQEQQAIITTLTTRIEALETK